MSAIVARIHSALEAGEATLSVPAVRRLCRDGTTDHTTTEDAIAAMQAVWKARSDEYQMDYLVTGTKANGALAILRCCGVKEAECAAEALVNGTCRVHSIRRAAPLTQGAASAPSAAFLVPLPPVEQRPYPVAAREFVEKLVRGGAAAGSPPMAELASPASSLKREASQPEGDGGLTKKPRTDATTAAAVKQELTATPPKRVDPVGTHPSDSPMGVSTDDSPAVEQPGAARVEVSKSPSEAAGAGAPGAVQPSSPSPGASVVDQSTAPAGKRQCSLIECMKRGKSSDRKPSAAKPSSTAKACGAVRLADGAEGATSTAEPPKPKPKRLPKAVKDAVNGSRSLATLAKAAAANAGRAAAVKREAGTTTAAPSSGAFILDEDDGNDVRSASGEEGSEEERDCEERERYLEELQMDAAPPAPPSVDEAAEVDGASLYPTANDEIIICDSSAPLVFQCPTAPMPPALDAVTKVAPTKRGRDDSVAQTKLNFFVHGDLAEFQRRYEKTVHAVTEKRGDEYLSNDVIHYRNRSTGDLLTPEAYEQLRSSLMTRLLEEQRRQRDGADPTESSDPHHRSAAAPHRNLRVATIAVSDRDKAPTRKAPQSAAETRPKHARDASGTTPTLFTLFKARAPV